MRKLFLPALFLLCCSVASAQAQLTTAQTRDAQWKNYALPQTNFARQVSPEKEILFRVPADWKQQGTELTFYGPQSAAIHVTVQKIPDGYPFQEYFAAVLKSIRDATAASEPPLTRKTQLQDLEAREILFDVTSTDGEVIRSTSWITVSGPLAVTFSLQAPVAHTTELEPFFKAVVQSVVFIPRDYQAFESLRSSIIKTSTAGPINDIESIVATLNEVTPDRDAAINRLASLFTSQPDVTVDLLLDRRPLVRAAAVQALSRSNNTALKSLLWEMLDDDELLVAEAAARSVATTPDVVGQTLKHSSSGYNTEVIARVWAFMPNEKRIELLQLVFGKTATPRRTPPPPVKAPGKTSVNVRIIDMAPVKPGTLVPDVTIGVSDDPNVQLGALLLVNTLTPQEFKLPLAKLMASNYDPLIAVGLQTAILRGEALPLDSLLKLVASADQQVSKLAAESLGFSASVADIPRVEALVSKDSAAAKKSLDDELKLSIKKIRFRETVKTAKSPTEAREIVGKALSDPSLDEFAWLYDCEPTVAGCGPASATPLKPDFAVKPFGENVLPRKLRHYTAIPNPGQSVQHFYETLHGLQMDSPRAQAGLVLMMSYWRQEMANRMSAPADAATLIEYTGIDPNSPIALASWTSNNALDSTKLAERQAVLLRVKDRARFERALQLVLASGSGIRELTDYVAIGTRGIAAIPALLPIALQAIQTEDPAKKSERPLLTYNFVDEKVWNGVRIKSFEHRSITSKWQIEGASVHVAFIADTAILTPDVATIRDLVVHAGQPDAQLLADNTEFRKAIERRGDIVYFSDLKAMMGEVAETTKGFDYKINESGELNIGNASWENSHHLTFDESDWAKPLLSFHPKDLAAPRDLLPATTIVYYFMNLDSTLIWSSKFRTDLISDDVLEKSNVWALDFKKEVLPELGPECGAALLELPDFHEYKGAGVALFCRLKSTKVADALSAGKLFTGVGPAKDFAQVKVGDDSFFVAARNGFLVVSNREKGLAALDGKTRLSETRDYSRAVEKVPGAVVAFGGYNLEAAIASANQKPVEGRQAQISSLVGAIASAFHSQNFFATATAGSVEAHSSVAMDREGRFPIADFTVLPRGVNITFVTLEPTGIPITDQNRLSSLVLKVGAKAPGPIDNIKEDVKTATQTVEQKSPKEMVLTVAARRGGSDKAIELPIKDAEVASFLKATTEFPAENEQVKEQARQIAGTDRDAWKVARKLADWTFKNLKWKSVENADASQTLATREADCSEFSALFVAMARSLGLPARTVTGLAYSGNSFGGHAWVEVWIGKWVELDPTWGTDFVDATHIRGNSSALATSAALNLIDIEVLETNRSVAEFQKTAKGLAQHLANAIPAGNKADVEAAIDLPVLTDQFMGEGAWSRLSDGEKEQMWSAYRRLIGEIHSYGDGSTDKMRVVHLEEKDNTAEAICVLSPSDMLLKLRLARRNDRWYLMEVVQSDVSLQSVFTTLQPTIAAIEKARAGQKGPVSGMTDYVRVLLLLQQDAAKAIAAADEALKTNAGERGLRFLKALALYQGGKEDDGKKLLRELNDEDFAPATHRLVGYLSLSDEDPARKEVIKLWEHYTALEPHDPRAFRQLADAYFDADDLVKAEAAYRKAIEINPGDTEGYINLILFLAYNERFADIRPVLTASDQHKDTDDDVFGSILRRLYISDEADHAEKLAADEPVRLKASLQGNLIIGRIHMDEGRYVLALNHVNTAAQIDKKSSAPYILRSEVHRQQHRWTAALKAADQALDLDPEDGEALYERACSLARLGRTKEAMSVLEKAIELYPDQASSIEYEKDLKPLSSLPAFKKLLPPPDKP
jgi:tetratricopeptide (TPR) repeat protein